MLTRKNVCIECKSKVDSLFLEFGGVGNVRLKRCESCGSVADMNR